MRRTKVFLSLIAAAVTAAVIWSCADKTVEPPAPQRFTGQAIIQSTQGYYHYQQDPDTDMVTFTVSGQNYSLEFMTHRCGLCNMAGTVKAFGTITMSLTPVKALTSNCDYVRVPTGKMPTVFRNDSLIVGPVTIGYVLSANTVTMYDTSVFEFHLKQQ